MSGGVIFSDESGQDNSNRYAAICTVSGLRKNLLKVHNELKQVLDKHDKQEIKFKSIKGGAKLKLGKEFLEVGLNKIESKKIRVHILVWDKHDQRHSIPNRCDIENLKRMYYKVIKEVNKDWKYIDNWSFYPDEYSAIDWNEDIVKYIGNTKIYKNSELFKQVSNFKFPNYQRTEEKDSKIMLNIQLADLLAGIVRNSRSNSLKYQQLINNKKKQFTLFPSEEEKISSNLKPKLELMHFFKKKASDKGLGVGFSKSKYFDTYNKKHNLFIWHYTPKSKFDKAPKKK
jgi:hypothetical protein